MARKQDRLIDLVAVIASGDEDGADRLAPEFLDLFSSAALVDSVLAAGAARRTAGPRRRRQGGVPTA